MNERRTERLPERKDNANYRKRKKKLNMILKKEINE